MMRFNSRRYFAHLQWLCTLVAVVVSFSGCSSSQDFSECETDGPCKEYGPKFHCADDGICEQMGREHMLREQCQFSAGNISDPDARIIGVILPLSGPLKGLADPLVNGIRLGIQDVNELSGLSGHPLGALICDSQGKPDQAEAAAKYLVEQVQAQAIIGPFTATNLFRIGPSIAKSHKIAVISPASTSPAVTELNDGGYVWRTVATDHYQGEAIARLTQHLMAEVIETPAEQAKVAFLVNIGSGSIYAETLRSTFTEHADPSYINLDDAERFPTIMYSDKSSSFQADVVRKLATMETRPDIIVLFGFPEVWPMISDYEAQIFREGAENQKTDTLYVVPGLTRDLQRAESVPTELNGRVWGTAVRTNADSSYGPFQSFRLRYKNKYHSDPEVFPFVSNAYDAVYALALGASGRPLKGSEIVKGLGMISDETTEVEANREGLQTGYNKLADDKKITLMGASGPLTFDPETGDITTDRNIILWCYRDKSFEEKGALFDGSTFTPGSCL